ncbi:sulfite exporter TauE/SafE family protein [Parendozoicomonas haliclonae]|uniref:Cytochrome C biogenesis protein transmembrane region n=1 Tax=Parendozoicomonas haliclonae TaxID=1960125 RepID=A0A1X7AHU3_9GAMM|nr:sulfite exporter TauE/SafE family protein [Parendozoicomonas haliclonae]SMA43578.1 Cytochrome C biogenesis protein transmembrane region [Parendozoicomonas haliclonae]
MTSEITLTAAFLLGLLGGGHCVGMCGGIMSALSIGSGGDRFSLKNMGILLGYNIGRIISYSIMGLLMGTLGWFLGGFSKETSIMLRVFSGVMLIAMGFYLAGWWMGLTVIERAGHKLWKRIQPKASSMLPVNSPIKAIGVGAVWGWLPCGLVYSTLVWAAASSNAVDSALLMMFFGLGTLPVLFVTGLLAKQMQTLLQSRAFRSGAGILVILIGIWTIPGPHQMWIMKNLDFSGQPHQMHGGDHSSMPAHNMQHEGMKHSEMNHNKMEKPSVDHSAMGH